MILPLKAQRLEVTMAGKDELNTRRKNLLWRIVLVFIIFSSNTNLIFDSQGVFTSSKQKRRVAAPQRKTPTKPRSTTNSRKKSVGSSIAKNLPVSNNKNTVVLNKINRAAQRRSPNPNERIAKIIAQNNKKVSKEEIDNKDILKLYLPILQENGIIVGDEEKEENQKRERIIQEPAAVEQNNIEKSLPKVDFSPTTINSPAAERGTLRPLIKNSSNLKRKQKKVLYSTNLNGHYQCVLEDGRPVKKLFTIHKNISLQEFLLENSVLEDQVINLVKILEQQQGITSLFTDQIVILKLRKTHVAFKQHKVNEFGDYHLERLVIFFNNGAVIIKIKNGCLIQKRKLQHQKENNFFAMNFDNLEDFHYLSSIQANCLAVEYDFLVQSIKFILKILLKHNKTIDKVQIIFQEKKSKTSIGKIHKVPRAIVIHIQNQKYISYIYKDFAGNFYLLNEKGTSINVELLDIARNPPLSGRVTSLFGFRGHPTMKKLRHHSGIDISAPMNLPVFSTLGGWVLYAGQHNQYGNLVIICYGNSLCTLYGHLNMCYVTTGDYVEPGRLIGAIGSTGVSTGNHLHYEVFKSTSNKYTLCPETIRGFLGSRIFLDPALRYRVSISLRSHDIPYFNNMKMNINNIIHEN